MHVPACFTDLQNAPKLYKMMSVAAAVGPALLEVGAQLMQNAYKIGQDMLHRGQKLKAEVL